MVQWWCSRHRLVVAIKIGVMTRYSGMTISLGESAFANVSEGTCWHITKRVDMTVIVDANGIEWILPSWKGPVEPSWRFIDVPEAAGSEVSMD